MRDPVDAGRIRQLMEALGRAGAAHEAGRVYLTGGGTAVLMGWRASTIDVDVKFVPDNDAILRAIPSIKEDLCLTMQARGLIDAERALEYFDRLEPGLYRYPAIHAPAFRRAVEDMFRS